MVTPRLIHPVPVTIFRLNRQAMLDKQDPDFHEPAPMGRVEESAITLCAQITLTTYKKLDPTRAGDNPSSDGHLTFAKADLLKHVTTPELALTLIRKGDRIEGIDGYSDNVFVIEVKPQAHRRGSWNLLFAYFTARSESGSR